MKKILVALVLSTVMLSGCGMFRSSKAWEKAKQENPLEIPPNMDRPNVSDALTIPTVNAQHEQAAATTVSPNSLHLPNDVDSAYKRVGLALGNGDIGAIASQSDAEHTYQVKMAPKMELGSKQGFLQRHFSNTQDAPGSSGSPTSGDKAAPTVMVQVKPAADGGSIVSATGDPQQVGRLIGALRARLGG
ncbi:hypothetical protein [Oleiagrimonas sp. MCCC 1A03011]|uniref:hypothetical protein n=1 Tax=Oleiagrimonas sp. MCCC 1A03011 TaxID=1926883 RepID=UPI000DC40A0C|nr:hypothetical protein [Oleiagrimonas sp. MCCC 1A03011]RAP57311.1 hypothetical protein BTJ49_09490 [Oleiagrimonas sp. MCCC 1A03011]